MKHKSLWLTLCLGGCTLQALGQQVLPTDVAGDREYARICREDALKAEDRVEQWRDFLRRYPDTRHANRIKALMAADLFDEGDYAEAMALYETVNIEALPVSEANRAVYHLAYNDYTHAQYGRALNAFRALSDVPGYEELVPYYIGEISLRQGEPIQAAQVAEDYLSRWAGHADEAEMKRILGEARYDQGQYAACIQPLQDYRQTAPRAQHQALYKLGMSLYRTGVYSQAAHALAEVAADEDALGQNACLHMGLSYLELKEHNRARMAFQQASEQNYDARVREQALYNYALCVHETAYQPFAESVTVFERFLNEYPNSAYTDQVNNYLVDTYMHTRSYEAALQSIAKIQHPGAALLTAKQRLLYRLGTQAFANAQFPQAIDYLTQSLAVGHYESTTRANACLWRGEAYYRQGQYAQAEEDFRQSLSLAPTATTQEYGDALYNLGYTAFTQQRYAEARTWFGRYTQRTTNPAVQQADALNRLGDCHFLSRSYAEARNCYALALRTDAAQGDYALYQNALVQGLQHDQTGKIETLNQLITQYKDSPYIDEALYEQGRAFVRLENNAQAISRYRMLVKNFPESALARQAAQEIGLLYYQDDKYPEAIAAYKQVLESYPGTEEARGAQRDLRSIYIDMNQIDEYAEYVKTLPDGEPFDAVAAHAEKAVSDYNRGLYDSALQHYQRLRDLAPTQEVRQQASEGCLRSAVQLNEAAAIQSAANDLLADVHATPESQNEALYYRAKAEAATRQTEAAQADWTQLSQDTRHVYGAEAKYRLAELHYAAGRKQEAEAVLLNYMEVSTPHTYWLARAFVLLADIYHDWGRDLDARQYLQSLQQNYTQQDDIQSMINTRLTNWK
jgi:tetratricopeptide (TPR) repeat protein